MISPSLLLMLMLLPLVLDKVWMDFGPLAVDSCAGAGVVANSVGGHDSSVRMVSELEAR